MTDAHEQWRTPLAEPGRIRPPSPPREWPPPPPPRSPIQRLAATAVVVAIAAAGHWITLPGFLPQADPHGSGIDVSVAMLGLTPIVFAYLAVEVVAWLVPGLTALRHAGPAGRAVLDRWSQWFAVLTACMMTANYVSQFSAIDVGGQFLMLSPTVATVGSTVVVGAYTAMLLFGIHQINRRGLGNGFSVLIAFAVLRDLYLFEVAGGSLGAGGPLQMGGAVFATMVTLRIVGRASPIPAPSSGLAPLYAVGVLTTAVASMSNLVPSLEPLVPLLTRGAPGAWMVEVSLVLVLTVAFAMWFQPVLLLQQWLTDTQVKARWTSLGASLFYLTLLLLLGRLFWNNQHIVGLMVIVAVSRDLYREWNALQRRPDLVPAWPLNHPTAPRPVFDALEDLEIPAFMQATTHRIMLQAFGPYVPIQVLVPYEKIEVARERIHAVLFPQGGPNPTDD